MNESKDEIQRNEQDIQVKTIVDPPQDEIQSSTIQNQSNNVNQTPQSKLLNYLPLDIPDELDRKWYAHFYHMQKAIQKKNDQQIIAILTQNAMRDNNKMEESPIPIHFQPEAALIYAILTENTLAKTYLKYLITISSPDRFKTCINSLQRIVDQKFTKLLVGCRGQLLWIVREFVHQNVAGVENVIISLMRYLTGGDPSRTAIWLASSIVRILIEHDAWLLSRSGLIPFVFHTFVRIAVDHTAATHSELLKQEIELITSLWTRRQEDIAQLGREAVRILNDAKDIPGLNTIWKQLRNVRDTPDNANESEKVAPFSVARLMAIPTPPKYLAYRLTPKMEEQLLFMMERVHMGYVMRYQKWFSQQFLSNPGSDALIPDLVRYICAVYHPSNQVLGSKVTPRYHLLGWLYLICKSPNVLARVQLAIFFDYLYFKPADNIMTVEPAILLMVKSLKSHPTMTLAMIQFLLFAVEKFASSTTNKQIMRKGVSTAFTMLLKVGVVRSILPLQSFPVLDANASELKGELHRLFPEHFPSTENIKPQAQSPVHTQNAWPSPASKSSSKDSYQTMASPNVLANLSSPTTNESPLHGSPMSLNSPVSPIHVQLNECSPSRSDHQDTSVHGGGGSSNSEANSLSSSSFLPSSNDDRSPDEVDALAHENNLQNHEFISGKEIPVPESLSQIGIDDIKVFQELIPDPCAKPTEEFLESLNDILVTWSRQDNASDLAAPLGEFIYMSLSQIIASSLIRTSQSIVPSCAGIFDSVLDQVISESADLYIPFLKSMYIQDVSVSFRLLAFCCTRNRNTSKNDTESSPLTPYRLFSENVKGSFIDNLLQDISRAQHIDDARAHTISLLGISNLHGKETITKSISMLNQEEMGAINSTVLCIFPYLCTQLHEEPWLLSEVEGHWSNLMFTCLSLATPMELYVLSNRLLLGEFSMFSKTVQDAMFTSLQWPSWEQYGMWELLANELQQSELYSTRVSSLKESFREAASNILDVINVFEHSETFSGLTKCLLLTSPNDVILRRVFSLSHDTHGDLPRSVLISWMQEWPATIKSFIFDACKSSSTTPVTDESKGNSLIDQVLHCLDDLTMYADRRELDKKMMFVTNSELASAILQIISTLDEAKKKEYPSLIKALSSVQLTSPAVPTNITQSNGTITEDEPPLKRQKLQDTDQ